jgi:hypothetical protein
LPANRSPPFPSWNRRITSSTSRDVRGRAARNAYGWRA